MQPAFKKSPTLEAITRRGSQTPLRRTRKDSLEDQVMPLLPPQTYPSHYFIKIFTADDTERQIAENKNEAMKKEEALIKSLIKSPVLARKQPKPKPQRKRRESQLYREEPW